MLPKMETRSGRSVICSREPRRYASDAWNVNCAVLVFFVIFGGIFETGDSRDVYRPSVIQLQNTARFEDANFRVYWNSPTVECQEMGVTFKDLGKPYGIRQNGGDSFRGEKIAIMYDPGLFPALLKNGSQPGYVTRNGGLPQDGNLKLHLKNFEEDLNKQIPDPGFNGIGIIDFESWRPVFRHNFGVLTIYKQISINREQKKHPGMSKSAAEKQAIRRFEKAARQFMQKTLANARAARPLARWGYYGFPYCFNMRGDKKSVSCHKDVMNENNRIQWLWDESDILFPSVYLNKQNLNPAERQQMIQGRVEEAQRVSKRSQTHPQIIPYFWYKYQHDRSEFLTKDDFYNSISNMNSSGLGGVVIWGSSSDVRTKADCRSLRQYFTKIIGPTAKEFHVIGSFRPIQGTSADENLPTTRKAFRTPIRSLNTLAREKTRCSTHLKCSSSIK